jgi:N-acetylmuramoyl-L-alanine amidase
MRRLVVFFTVVGLLLVLGVVPVASEGGRLSGYKICIDPGHGGADPGAENPAYGLQEKDINLDVAFGLKTILEADGAEVALTRIDDRYYENRDRYTFCNQWQADILVSVHTNSVLDQSIDGSLVLHSPRTTSVDDWSLAASIYDAMYPYLLAGAPAGVNFISFGLDRFASGVLFKSDMPAAMIEPLFMSHPAEAYLLEEETVNEVDADGLVVLDEFGKPKPTDCMDVLCRRGQIVQSVRDGIIAYFAGGNNEPPVASFVPACEGLTCTFDASASTDPEGGSLEYVWDFGDDSGAGSGETVSHTYMAGGDYTVLLTVTDDGGLSDTESQPVTVSGGGGGFTLAATAYKVKGVQTVDLMWSGTSAANVDVYRDDALLEPVPNVGAYTDTIGKRGLASYTYQVCEAGTDVCSNVVTAEF